MPQLSLDGKPLTEDERRLILLALLLLKDRHSQALGEHSHRQAEYDMAVDLSCRIGGIEPPKARPRRRELPIIIR